MWHVSAINRLNTQAEVVLALAEAHGVDIAGRARGIKVKRKGLRVVSVDVRR